uniref:Uncharacterized protein n=1 Tax=Anguilla anguilla TaxID=7936 RepID=A0A0E9VW24_ANGAN
MSMALFKVSNAWSDFLSACCTTPMWQSSTELCGLMLRAFLKWISARLNFSCLK